MLQQWIEAHVAHALQTFLGHADVRSTRRYARMADSALLEILRPPRGAARRGAR